MDMGKYDVMQVCLNGHQITASYNLHPEHRKDFCDECGERTINSCPKCKTPIQGEYQFENVVAIGFKTPVPEFCFACGAAYPWTERKTKDKGERVHRQEIDPLMMVEHICSRFHLVAQQLARRYDGRSSLRISDEYDVQDLLHSLLKINFDDIRPEEWTPSYAGGSSRMDFLLKNEKIVVETKKTRGNLGSKELGDQLIVDINRYQKHPDCKVLFCFVYDPELRISNPQSLENDLSRKTDDFKVKVLVMPKGY
jgi:hypothetical protein